MPPTDEKNFSLDDSAEELYRQLGGLDDTEHEFADDLTESALMNLLAEEEKRLDYFRLLLSDATCLFAGVLANSIFPFLEKENEERLKLFLATLRKIKTFPKFDGKIFCRLRGKQCPSDKTGSESYDYEVSFGNFLVDYQVAKIVGDREEIKGLAMYSKLIESFKNLSLMNIFNFSIDIGEGTDADFKKLEETIRLLLLFHNKESDKSLYVNDEYGQPSINLTLLAASNGVKPAALQNLVDKIKPMMLAAPENNKLYNFTTVYEIILASKQYRQQLKKMPLEVNNVQWLTETLLSDSRPEKSKESAKISRLILSKYGNNLKMATEVISSISSEGYIEIRTEVMGKRLALATSFLDLAEEEDEGQTIQEEALLNIEEGLEQIPDETFDNINIDASGEVTTVNEQGETTGWTIHKKILGLLNFFKRRSSIKQKVRDIANKNVEFTAEDYAVIARNFKISELEAAHLIDLLKSCFDAKGNFRRHFFEQNVPKFLQYESKVFEFLWHYLKELSLRKDRVSFLNALQLLIGQLKHPQDALNTLLLDIFKNSAQINFSDRNGLMLGNILLRLKNREVRSNIELTPEEVLLVQKGLNQTMVSEALNFFEQYRENIIQKIRNITETVHKSAVQDGYKEDEMQPRFLLYLMRELVIFLALTGGDLAQSFIQGIVQEFGQPTTDYYKNMRNKENLRHSLQLLQVAARALRRFNDLQAHSLFNEIASRKVVFANLDDDQAHKNHVKQVMERIIQQE